MVHVGLDEPLPSAAGRMGLPTGGPVLVVVGGASGMSEADQATADRTVHQVVLPVVRQTGATVVDGGTASGVMQLIGIAASETGWTGPLVGVAVEGLVAAPGDAAGDRVPLDPHHTHVLLVPGSAWGDEAPLLARLATLLAAGAPSATLLVNGGDIGRTDIASSRAEGRPVIVLRGSGRLADELAETDPDVTVLDPARPVQEQHRVLLAALTRPAP